MCNSDASLDFQPRGIRLLSVPEYYSEYRETGNGYAGFLGTSIAAKVCIVCFAPFRHVLTAL